MTTKIITWDWKEPAPIGAIAGAVSELSRGGIGIREIDDTGGDLYAVVIADHSLNSLEAQEIYDADQEEEN